MSTLVTGDAVVLELPAAGFGTRVLALAIDVVVYLTVLVAMLYVLVGVLDVVDGAAATAISLALVVTMLVVVPAVIETLTRGRSLGKLALGLRVVRDDGGPVRSRQSAARALTGFGEIYLLAGLAWLPTILLVIVTSRTKRFGDLLAGTYVVKERTALVGGAMAQMPPELAGWARGADLGQVPGQLALSARSFLAQAGGFTSAARADLASRLRTDLAQYVSPAPPAGTHPERFVAAVLAERRRRDLHRLQVEAGQMQRLREMSASVRDG